MAFFRIQMTAYKLSVVLLDITCMRLHQQIVAVIHFLTKRVQRLDHLRKIRNNSLIGIRQLGQIMTFYLRIDTKLYHLRVYQYEL